MQYISPSNPKYETQLEAFMAGSYDERMTLEQKEKFVANLVNRGLTQAEANNEFESRKRIIDYLHDNKDNLSIVWSNCMFISYGYNP